MKVDFNNSISLRFNFKAIGSGDKFPLDSEERQIAGNIVNILRTSKDEFDGKTAEDYYKQQHDLDFLILPGYSLRHKCVKLFGTHFNRNEKGELTWRNSSNFRIGKYNLQDTKDNNKILEDVQKAKEKNDEQALRINMWGYLSLLVFMYGAVFGPRIFRKPQNPQKVIENADTLIKKADTIKTDTVNFLNHVK